MKIYFAYRTGYHSNHRYLKEFESNSILEFFQTHWQTFINNESYEDLFGIDVYGFPIHQYQEEVDEFVIPPKPTTLDELKERLEKGVYCNDIIVGEHCVQVLTDDDEIELAWYVFDETYKNANMDKLALWFYDKLPSTISENTQTISYQELAPKLTHQGDYFGEDEPVKAVQTCQLGSDDCESYFVSSAIYDSSNLEDTQAIQLKGTNLNGLIGYLKSYDFDAIKDYDYLPYGFLELYISKSIANDFKTNELNSVIDLFNKYIGILQESEFDDIDWQEIDENDEVEKSFVNVNEHIAEFGIYDRFCYHYYVLFDDKWAGNYPQLAKSIVHFGRTWEI